MNADGYKFKENSRAYNLHKWQVEKIQNIVLHKVKQSKDTLEKIKKLKGRASKPKDKK